MRASRRSPTLERYVLKSFLPTFLVSMSFFVLILEMADLFMNIVQYMQNEVPFASVLSTLYLYLPKCASVALPIAVLFSVSYTLGTLYANNELIVVFGSGVRLVAFISPLLALTFAVSLGYFAFEDRVVIPTVAAKKALVKTLLKTGTPAGLSDVTILGSGKRFVWNVRYFDRENSAMTGVTIVERDDEGAFVSRLNAQSAEWTGEAWRFSAVRRFFWQGKALTDESYGSWEDPDYDEPPDSFRGGGKTVAEMSIADAKAELDFLRRAGLPSSAQAAEYWKRFAFALTPFIVTILSASIVGRYKKNVLLMSLLLSLVAATLYYVVQMVTMLLAKADSISPFMGAFAPVIFFALLIAGLFRFRSA